MHEIKLDQPHFGLRIRQVRRQRNLSQAALAKLLGTSQESVSRVENGKIRSGKSVDLLQDFLARQVLCDDDVQKLVAVIGASEELRLLIVRVVEERSRDA
ncbi:helix-turn-helix transcriptional regulator [Celeribacter indicus]|uniref:helix-turn-helix transcriptional regulator n=1 Tax=Celeribacter indicus TaxID=1208324 RepID=UPI0005C33775